MLKETIFVDTPYGKRDHGYIVRGCFYRVVDWDKDRMRIFDAWSINPQAQAEIEARKIKIMRFFCKIDTYEISTANARKNGFIKNFGGGDTIYIPLKHWKKTTKPKEWQCPRCDNRNMAEGNQCMICYLDRPQP